MSQEINQFVELDLDERLLKAIDKIGWTAPTEVQQAAIPVACYGQDLMVSAETGTGKTGAYLLPLLDRLLHQEKRADGPRALILLPTRELAHQVFKQLKTLSSFTHYKTWLITGGESFRYQQAELRKNPELLVATPGRILEHLEKNSTDLDSLEILVIDEADRMLDMGFADDVIEIASRCDIQRQTLFLSATLKAGQVSRMAEQLLSEPEKILLNKEIETAPDIEQQYLLADDERHKERLLLWLLANEVYNKVLVFTNTRESTMVLSSLLQQHNIAANYLQGEMAQEDRKAVMASFRQGKNKVLVATDVAARGLDISGVDLVINFHMPRNGDDYLHRIGRTGRAGATGTAISLISPNEWNLKAAISRYLNVDIASRKIKGLEGAYKGPKKLKSNGKAAGSKKKKKPTTKKLAGAKKKSDKKKSPARKKPDSDGHTPLKKKK